MCHRALERGLNPIVGCAGSRTRPMPSHVALGLKARIGRAVIVAVGGDLREPRFVLASRSHWSPPASGRPTTPPRGCRRPRHERASNARSPRRTGSPRAASERRSSAAPDPPCRRPRAAANDARVGRPDRHRPPRDRRSAVGRRCALHHRLTAQAHMGANPLRRWSSVCRVADASVPDRVRPRRLGMPAGSGARRRPGAAGMVAFALGADGARCPRHKPAGVPPVELAHLSQLGPVAAPKC